MQKQFAETMMQTTEVKFVRKMLCFFSMNQDVSKDMIRNKNSVLLEGFPWVDIQTIKEEEHEQERCWSGPSLLFQHLHGLL